MQDLTERQHDVLHFIALYTRRKGIPPSIREIGEAFGIKSTNGVNDHLSSLERKGCLRREDSKSRHLWVTAKGYKELDVPADPLADLRALSPHDLKDLHESVSDMATCVAAEKNAPAFEVRGYRMIAAMLGTLRSDL